MFGRTLFITTLPLGSSNWVAPSGVTLITSAVGKGSDGTAGSWSFGAYGQFGNFGGATNGASGTVNWSTIYNAAVSNTNSLNASGSGQRTVTWAENIWVIGPNGQLQTNTGGTHPNLTVRGTATTQSWSGSPLTSGTVTYPGLYGGNYWATVIEAFGGGSNGAATTAFGQSFPGGTSTTPVAPTTTFTNITVTPGTSYPIVNNQSLVITYYK